MFGQLPKEEKDTAKLPFHTTGLSNSGLPKTTDIIDFELRMSWLTAQFFALKNKT